MRGSGGFQRGSGGFQRGSGGIMRGSGGIMRGSGAPIVSPDGQMIFFTENPVEFITGTFFIIQGMAGLPPLPPGRTLVGQGYNLVVSPEAILPVGSASIQYLSNDVLVAGASEEDLALYFWDGHAWRELETVLNTYFNLASAPSQGEGVYALMASVKIPLYGPGWNNFAYPMQETRLVTEALASISGYYTTVYGYEAEDEVDPWEVHDVTAPDYVQDLAVLKYGHGYWINVSDAITLYLKSGVEAARRASGSDLPFPPATYYGAVQSSAAFTPTAGMTVTAWMDDHLCGQGAVTETETYGIVYVVDVLAADLGDAAGCGAPGREVSFQVGAQAMVPTAVWSNSQLWELALSPKEYPAPGERVYLPLIMR
jgi:hypothetical protein